MILLPITMVKEQYNFTEEEFNIYLHNHFHSLEEIDKNVNSSKALDKSRETFRVRRFLVCVFR